jgi:hypothetical protein
MLTRKASLHQQFFAADVPSRLDAYSLLSAFSFQEKDIRHEFSENSYCGR